MEFIRYLINNEAVKILIIFIVLDTIFGILRAIREKQVNSNIGIDGIIRKVGMLFSILFLSMIDYITNIDLIGFIPDGIKDALNIGDVGVSSLFILLFDLFEILSILKNMILCKLPIPHKLQQTLEKVFKEFTGEIKGVDEDVKGN